MIDFAKRCYRFAHRHIHPEAYVDPNPFPIDAWGDTGYAAWFESHKTFDSELALQRGTWESFSVKPTFSFIVPLYKTSHEFLHTMADSVLRQTYPNLQLVLVNASPDMADLASEVERYRVRDERVTVVTLERNLGITENTNKGLDASVGDFCCFLDHDDFIEPDLLFQYVRALNDDPEIDVLYCDEDLVSRDEKTGTFRSEHVLFKGALEPELLLCKNYIVHLMTVRRTLIDQMPLPDARFDGAQDYNMVLYCTSHARKVRNIQKVLYHWRISEASTAANPDAKPYSRQAYRLAAAGELERRVPFGRIIASGIVNVHNIWMDRDAAKTVSVLLAFDGDDRALERALEFLEQTNTARHAEVIICGPETDGFEDIARRRGAIRIVVPSQSRFVCWNEAARRASGEHLLFMDASCTFNTPEPLEQLSALLTVDGVGVSAPKILYRDGRNKSFGVAVTSARIMPLYRGYEDDFPGYECNLRAMHNVSAAGLQGLCTPRALFEELGGFDESFEGEIGAVDYCKRVRDAGYRVVVTPTVKLEVDEPAPELYYVHEVNAPDYTASDLARFDAKWPGAREAGDPYFNRNLDQSSCYCQIPQE